MVRLALAWRSDSEAETRVCDDAGGLCVDGRQFRTADLAALTAERVARPPQEHSLSRSSVSVHSSKASSQRPRVESAIANLAR
jgi:hypothetical protein